MKTTLLLSVSLAAGGFLGARALRSASPASGPEPVPAPATTESSEGSPQAPAPAKAPAKQLPRPEFDAVVAAGELELLPLLIAWLPAADAGEMTRMAAALEAKKRLHFTVWTAFALRWAEVSPEEALAFARPKSLEMLTTVARSAPDTGYALHIPLADVYQGLLAADRERALDFLKKEPRELLQHLLQLLMSSVEQSRREAWAAANSHLPEAAVWAPKKEENSAAGAGRYNRYAASEEVDALREMLSRKDLAGCRAKLDAMPMNYHRSLAEMDYAAALADQKSPAEAVQWATANLKGLARVQAIALAAKVLSKTDPLGALKMLRENKVPDFGMNQIGITRAQGQGGGSTSYRGQDREMLAHTLKAAAKVDPKATMDYLLGAGGILPRDMQQRYIDNDDTTNNGSLGRAIYKEWVAKDAKSAAAWLAKQRTAAGISEMVPLVAGPLLAQGAEQGREFIQALPQGGLRDEMVRYAASDWAQTDTVNALQWAADQGGQAALEGAFRELAGKNAAVASEHFASLPTESQTAQLPLLAEKLGEQKPQQLPQFMSTLTPEQQATVDLRQPITRFAEQNVEQASAWVNGMEPGPLKDTGISGLVDYLIRARQPDPEAAAHWAAASSVPADASRRLARVAEAWQRQNPSGAADAIRASTLPPAVQQQLIGFLK